MNRVSKEDHGSKLGFTERETEGKKNLFQPRVYFFAYLIVFNALRGGLVSMSLEENINLNTKTIQLKFDCYFVTSQ